MQANWKDIDYLLAGSAVQRLAYRLLQQHEVLTQLKPYHPILVGTFPLDITVPCSDLDVICEVPDLEVFAESVAAGFSHYPAYVVRYPVLAGIPSIIVSFWLESVEVEVFGQPLASEQQNGYRHMIIEARLLALGSSAFRQQVIASKASGLKTEPAFAQLLGLAGDAYQAVLALESVSDAGLTKLLAGAGWGAATP
ncbi:DUF4269 domain-containing protein [Hymenobacter negativus]|uniref:DUF4269 domain-containing protein n=1 Tax=Hymenobacter negativus TaxID=2795026 RepID=A0ABS3QIF6_9BACT|nr:DUF4269 domain-containing protein [Hymenobacter negativus]MBO2010942.1 DUF4269 domain-containing protein [Hymenobacter negativus]